MAVKPRAILVLLSLSYVLTWPLFCCVCQRVVCMPVFACTLLFRHVFVCLLYKISVPYYDVAFVSLACMYLQKASVVYLYPYLNSRVALYEPLIDCFHPFPHKLVVRPCARS